MKTDDVEPTLGMAAADPRAALINLARIVVSPLVASYLRAIGVKVGRGCRFYGRPIVRRPRGSTISMGDGCDLRSWSSSNVLGLANPVVLSTLTSAAELKIGNRVGISGATLCAGTRIVIGDDVAIGAGALITDSDHHPIAGPRGRYRNAGTKSAPITIESEVFIGARAIILRGVRIGSGAIVGAGAVVSSDVEPNTIVGGNPARPIGVLSPESEAPTD
jgi:acetyltransferase-like isoleucine patch superfamily enzyme